MINMFCGYNQKMSQGMLMLLEAFIEHGILDKSKDKSRSIDNSLKMELSDLGRLISEADDIEDSKKKDLVKGVAMFARGFYSLFDSQNIEKYKNIVKSVDAFYWKMDNKYYPELENKKEAGNPNDVKILVQYLNDLRL
jgi:hypothetical protein